MSAAPAPALTAAALAPLARGPLLALFDIDGTLAPIAPRPEDARVPAATRDALARLRDLPAVSLGVVTGRAALDGARLVGLPGLWVVGNHGIERRAPDGTVEIAPEARPFAGALSAAARALAAAIAETPGARVEDKGWSLSLHYRLAAADAIPALRATAERVADAHGLRLTHGKAVLELRPPAAIDKGVAVVALAEHAGAVRDGCVLFVGDDVTDEDAFVRLRESLPAALTVKVGPPEAPTWASWRVDGPRAVQGLVESLVALRERGD